MHEYLVLLYYKITIVTMTDEKGNPYPIEDKKNGGDPICPEGHKIDYDFDPMNDPINPMFRCISALKEPEDDIKRMIENPEKAAAALGGSKKITRRHKRYTRRRHKRRRYNSRRHRRKY